MSYQQQIRDQVTDGNKVIFFVTESRNGKRGRKINTKKGRTIDLTASNIEVKKFVIDTWHKGSTQHYYGDGREETKVIESIEEITKKISDIKGSVIITNQGYWENCSLTVESQLFESVAEWNIRTQ